MNENLSALSMKIPLSEQQQFAELVARISAIVDSSGSVDWDQLKLQYPGFADDIDEIRPALDALKSFQFAGNGAGPSPISNGGIDASRTLGDFRILREIGRGGMGVVYEAQQISIDRRVALKILPLAELIDYRALTRFKNEVTAIATLEHPHIVSVYSIGEERGIHYYAMKLVHGRSLAFLIRQLQALTRSHQTVTAEAIDQVVSDMQGEPIGPDNFSSAPSREREPDRLDENGSETVAQGGTGTARVVDPKYFRNIVRMFLQAADGLQHAHENGIVHRDVKPGNLLLDKNGRLIITDFGLARIETGVGITMTGDVIGTLRYMSPEQVQAGRIMVDHRTDVYSLGATLYELVTLQPIWSGHDRAELISKILLEEPVRPQKINPSIPNDLETVILKAIAKNPSERYDSARMFADDLQRFLDLKPVAAKRPTAVQRINKWSRRNPAIVWSAAMLLVITTLASVASTVLISHQRELALAAARKEVKARTEAEQTLAQLTKGNEIITSIFNDLDIDEIKEGTEPLEAVLAKRLVKAGQEISGQSIGDPLVVAAMQNRLGESLVSLGFGKEALELYKLSWATRSRLLEPDDTETLESQINVGSAYRRVGQASEAVPILEKAFALSNAKLGREDRLTLECMLSLAGTYSENGQQDKGLEFYEETLALMDATLGSDDKRTLTCINNLGVARVMANQPDKALPVFQQLFERTQHKFGTEDVKTIAVLANLAWTHYAAGQVEQSIPLFKKALLLCQENLGTEHPSTVNTMSNLARAYNDIGERVRGLRLIEKAVELSKIRPGKEHPETINRMQFLSDMYYADGKYDESLQLLEQIFDWRQSNLGFDHIGTLASQNTLGISYIKRGQIDKGYRYWVESQQRTEELFGPLHWNSLVFIHNYAIETLKFGHLDSLPLLERTLELMKTGSAPDEINISHLIMTDLTMALLLAGQLDRAQVIANESLENATTALGPEHNSTLGAMRKIAEVHLYQDQLDHALRLLEQALEGFQTKAGTDPKDSRMRHQRDTLMCQTELGIVYKYAGRLDDALKLFEEVHGAGNIECKTNVGAELLDAYIKTGKEDQAAALVDEVMEAMRERYPETCPERARQMAFLGKAYFLPIAAYDDAELLLRECRAIRESITPDQWQTFETLSMLGEALLGQKRFAEAEPLLLAGYEGLVEREKSIPPIFRSCVNEALNRLADFYTAWNLAVPDKAHEQQSVQWQQQLSEHEVNSAAVATTDALEMNDAP